MPARPWSPPVFPPGELDLQLLRLCAPEPVLPPLWVNPEPLLARALALDVFPLAFHRLRNSPRWLAEKVSPEWEERFRMNAARNLLLDTEQARLLERLAAAGVLALPLKGTRLAARLYADPALRAQEDIDLYVPPRQLPAALAALEAGGYRRATAAGLCPERLARTGDEFTSECSLLGGCGGLPVLLELHWRLLPLPDDELEAIVARAGELPAELEFLYLCLQAAADRWGALKGLTDLAHWIHQQPPDWERLPALAADTGLARIVWITLRVLLNYFGLPIPEAVPARLAWAAPRALARAAVASPFAPLEPLHPAATHRLRLALRERFRDRVRYGVHLLRPTASDLAAVALPRGFGFAYWGVRWLRLAGLLAEPERRAPAAQGVGG